SARSSPDSKPNTLRPICSSFARLNCIWLRSSDGWMMASERA
ncbi:hypothetical protein D039_2282B, partial [Vibrio parahaemolyticus EKP-028]